MGTLKEMTVEQRRDLEIVLGNISADLKQHALTDGTAIPELIAMVWFDDVGGTRDCSACVARREEVISELGHDSFWVRQVNKKDPEDWLRVVVVFESGLTWSSRLYLGEMSRGGSA